mgnify:CR=1 FL=1
MGIISMVEKHTLSKIIESLYHFSDEITVASLTSNEKLQEILQNELMNNSELFFINGFKLMYSPVTTIVYPNYIYDEKSFKFVLDSCRRKANQLISRIQGTNDYARALQAHDFLARNVGYENGTDRELHTIVGPFTKKKGVCEGYAKAFKYLLDMMGIPCKLIYGFGCDPGVGVEESHAWNVIQLDGNWLHVDVTFDTTIRNGHMLRYDYFGLTTEQILKDHRYVVDKYPAANQLGYGYYDRNNLVMTTRKQMRDYISSVLRSGKSDCVFKLPDSSIGDNLDRKVSSEIHEVLKQLRMNMRYTMNFNIKQRVFQVSFGR